jgi:hypothetical protein
MASTVNAILCALIATAFWTLLGFALARHLLPRVLAVGAAPVIGWATHSAVMLPVYLWIGLSPMTVVAVGALCILLSGFSLSLRVPGGDAEDAPGIPPWTFAAAAVLALVPAVAILPKYYGDAVQFADPIFDHSKSAIIDAITRLGVPPVNPVFGGFGAKCLPDTGSAGCLAYYYLWHFSAAEVALAAGATGWEADIGLTWFTAVASLTLMMGIAVWLAKRSAAAIWVVTLAAAASLWITLYWIFGTTDLRPVLLASVGMGGWLFQATWAPQHVMAGSCVVAAMLVVVRLTERQSWTLVLTLALLIVAGFESSTFVGGITFAIAALLAAPIVFTAVNPMRRRRLLAALAVAALLVVCLIAPLALNQWAAVRARGGGTPVTVSHYRVFGEFLAPALRRLLDVPGYWLVILPAELPASFFAGFIALIAMLRGALARAEKLTVALLACLAGAGLMVSWLLVSTLGNNNDLGLRAIIPAEMVLIIAVAAAAAGLAKGRLRIVVVAIALAGLVLSLPDTAKIFGDNVAGRQRPGGVAFAHSPELWAAMRRYTPPAARVANNPLFLKELTPWPVNISWALLANRSSCFAGLDLALAYTSLPPERRAAINAQFVRVFAGEGTADDVNAMAAQYGCDVVALVPTDGAWDRDPFAASADYLLAETREGRWRIYVRQPLLPLKGIKSRQTN